MRFLFSSLAFMHRHSSSISFSVDMWGYFNHHLLLSTITESIWFRPASANSRIVCSQSHMRYDCALKSLLSSWKLKRIIGAINPLEFLIGIFSAPRAFPFNAFVRYSSSSLTTQTRTLCCTPHQLPFGSDWGSTEFEDFPSKCNHTAMTRFGYAMYAFIISMSLLISLETKKDLWFMSTHSPFSVYISSSVYPEIWIFTRNVIPKTTTRIVCEGEQYSYERNPLNSSRFWKNEFIFCH